MSRPSWMKSIRFQLSLWYTLALAAVFIFAGSLLYVGVLRVLVRQTDQALFMEAGQIAQALPSPGDSKSHNDEPNPTALIDQISQPVSLSSRLISNTVFVRLARLDSGRTVALSSSLANQPELSADLVRMSPPQPGHPLARFTGPDEESRVRCLSLAVPRTAYFLQVAVPWDQTEDFLTNLSVGICGAVLLFLLASVAGSWLLVGKTLQPIDAIVTKAEKMTGADFSPLLPEDAVSDNEVGHLVTALNALMKRLHSAFDAQRRFTADSSHELRTPLTILQGEFELALGRERTPEDYKTVLISGLEEIARMTRIVDSLSVLARYDAAQPASYPDFGQEVRLARIIDEAADTLKQRIREKNMRLVIDAEADIRVYGSADALCRMARNLVENAIAYTEPGGRVEVKTERENGTCRLTVSDNGVGISPDDLPHVFERFYRADKARSYKGGTGLGLSIVSSIVEEHGGQITVESEIGRGTTFTVTLPYLD